MCVLLVPVYLKIFKSSDYLKNKMKFNFLFPICPLKSRKYNRAKYCLAKIAKLSTSKEYSKLNATLLYLGCFSVRLPTNAIFFYRLLMALFYPLCSFNSWKC